MILFSREKRRNRDRADTVYRQIAAQARNPAFFREFGVADTINGRFEILVLHLFAVVNRLVRGAGPDAEFARLLMEAFVTDMDRNYREIGISDVRVGKKIKTLYGLFGARIAHYDLVLGATAAGGGGPRAEARAGALAGAIAAHVPGAAAAGAGGGTGNGAPGEAAGECESAGLGRYVIGLVDRLADLSAEDVRAGAFVFPDPASAPGGQTAVAGGRAQVAEAAGDGE